MPTKVTDLAKVRKSKSKGVEARLAEARQELDEQDDLLPGEPEAPPVPKALILDEADERMQSRTLPLDQIIPGENVRQEIHAEGIKELADSIKAIGVLQPLIVRPMDNGQYQIIAGHRRYAAAQSAKLPSVPVIIRSSQDQDAIQASIIENVQREDLDPIDEAKGYQRLLETPDGSGKKLSQSQLAKVIGKSQPYISNALRLLQLPDELQDKVSSGALSVGAAKSIVSLPKASQEKVAKAAVSRKMTTAQVEQESRFERERIEREAKQAADRKASLESMTTVLSEAKEAGLIQADTEVRVYGSYWLEDLKKAGFNVVEFSVQTDTLRNGYPCDCKGWLLDKDRIGGGEYQLTNICVNREHPTKHAEQERAAQDAERKLQTDSVNAARVAVLDASITPDGTLTSGGLRLALYGTLTEAASKTWDRRYDALREFMSRRKRIWTSNTFGQVWEAIMEISDREVAEELLAITIGAAFTNVYADSAREANAIHATVRQHFVDTAGLDETIVWGGHDPVQMSEVTPGDAEFELIGAVPHTYEPDLDAGPQEDEAGGPDWIPCLFCNAPENDEEGLHVIAVAPGQEELALDPTDPNAPEATGEPEPEVTGEPGQEETGDTESEDAESDEEVAIAN